MPNKDRPLVDRHPAKNGEGWLWSEQEQKEEPSKEEQVVEELSDDDLEGLSGGFKFNEHKKNPTGVPMDQG